MYDVHADSQHFLGCKAFRLDGSSADGGLFPFLFIIARIPIPWRKEACMGIGMRNLSVVQYDVDFDHLSSRSLPWSQVSKI